MEDGYNDTPYHSKTHAADVLQSMHTLLTLGGLASRMGDELIMLAGQLPPPSTTPSLQLLLSCISVRGTAKVCMNGPPLPFYRGLGQGEAWLNHELLLNHA